MTPTQNINFLTLVSYLLLQTFLADRTIGRAFGTMCRLSSVVVCDVLHCGETVRPSKQEAQQLLWVAGRTAP